MIVEVFRTNVSDPVDADSIMNALKQSMQLFRVTFDLDDCDRVLRVEGSKVCAEQVMKMLAGQGFSCVPMD